MSRASTLVALLLTTVVAMTGTAVPVLAAGAAHGPSASRPHCVVTAQSMEDTGRPDRPRCFPTFARAVADATDGAVKLDADATVLREADLVRMPVSSSKSIVGVEYQHAGFGGWTLTVVGSNQGCTTGSTFRVASLAPAYDDQISSAKTYGGCKSRHYSAAGLSGASYLCGCASMGSMSDRTSSIYFSRTG